MQRNTAETYGDMLHLPVKAKTMIYQGHIVAIENGTAVLAKRAENLVVVGRAEETVTGGYINVKRGVFLYENDTENPLDDTHILKKCYIKNSTTVTSLDTGTSIAGTVIGFEDGQVKVDFK